MTENGVWKKGVAFFRVWGRVSGEGLSALTILRE